MKLTPEQKKYFKQLGSLTLSQNKRQSTWEELAAYADLHSASNAPVRSLAWTRWSFTYTKIAGAALAVVLFVGGGTAWAAQGALPDEILYPIKISFNESVRSALAWSDEAQAKLAVALLEERIEEAATLGANDRLQGETKLSVSQQIKHYAETADQLAAKTDAAFTIATRNKIDNLLASGTVDELSVSPRLARRPNPPSQTLATTGGGSSAMSSVGARTTEQMSIKADLADDAIGMSATYNSESHELTPDKLEERLNALVRVIESHAAELDDALQVELNTKLSRAAHLLIELESKAADSITVIAEVV